MAGCSSCRPRPRPSPGSSRRPRPRPRALDDRERHALPADAVRARGAPRQVVIFAMMCYAGDDASRRARDRAVPRPGHAARGHAQADAVPGMYPPEDHRTIRWRVAHAMFLDRSTVAAAATIIECARGVGRAAARGAAARPRRGAWRACRPTPRRSPTATERIMANVAAFYEGPEDEPTARRGWRSSPTASSQATIRRVRELPRGRGRGARPRRLSRADLGPAGEVKAHVRPDQPVPPQPERPAARGE